MSLSLLHGSMPAVPRNSQSVGGLQFSGEVTAVEAWLDGEWVDITEGGHADPDSSAPILAEIGAGAYSKFVNLSYGPTSTVGTWPITLKITDASAGTIQIQLAVRIYEGANAPLLKILDNPSYGGAPVNELDTQGMVATSDGGIVALGTARGGKKITVDGTTYTSPGGGGGTHQFICKLDGAAAVEWVAWNRVDHGEIVISAVQVDGDSILVCTGWEHGASAAYDGDGDAAQTQSDAGSGWQGEVCPIDLTTGQWGTPVVWTAPYFAEIKASGTSAVVAWSGGNSIDIDTFYYDGSTHTPSSSTGTGKAFAWVDADGALLDYQFLQRTSGAFGVYKWVVEDGGTLVIAADTNGGSGSSIKTDPGGSVDSNSYTDKFVLIRLYDDGTLEVRGSSYPSGFVGVNGLASHPSGVTFTVLTDHSGSQSWSIFGDISHTVPTGKQGTIVHCNNGLEAVIAKSIAHALTYFEVVASGDRMRFAVLTNGTDTVDGVSVVQGYNILAYDLAQLKFIWCASATPNTGASGSLMQVLADGTLYGIFVNNSASTDSTLNPEGTTVGHLNVPRDVWYSISATGHWGEVSSFVPPRTDTLPAGPQWTEESYTAWPGAADEGDALSGVIAVYNPDDVLQEDPGQGDLTGEPSSGSPPGAPTDLAATPGDASVTLTWDAVMGADGYHIYLELTVGGNVVRTRSGETTSTSFAMGALENGTSHHFYVAAYNSSGDGATADVTVTPSNAYDPATQPDLTWTSLIIVMGEKGSRYFYGSQDIGQGVAEIEQADMTATIAFTPDENWYGQLSMGAIAVAQLSDGSLLPSAVLPLEVAYANVPDPLGEITGEFAETPEDTPVDAVFTVEDPGSEGGITWNFADTTLEDDDTNPAGTLSVVSGSTTASPTFRFTPVANWNGTCDGQVRAHNAAGYTDYFDFTITITPVPDAPMDISPTTVGAFDEDTFHLQTFTWTDPDFLYDDSGSWTMQISYSSSGPWYAETLDTETIFYEIVDEDTDDQEGQVRISPHANFNGAYSFYLRIKDESGESPLYSAATLISGTITAIPDQPSPPIPHRMPLADPGETVSQVFETFDPDPEGGMLFEVAATRSGPWSSGIVLADIGTIDIVDTGEVTCTVLFAADADAIAPVRYHFYIRATDDLGDGLVSEPSLVIGAVATPQISCFLQRVVRGESSTTISHLCPLSLVSRLKVTDSLDGPGGGSVTVDAAEVARRASTLGISIDDLLKPNSVELVVRSGELDLWVGPLSEPNYESANSTIDIEARGLISYFEKRELEELTGFTNEEQADIAWALINAEQDKPYGDLVFTDGTTPTDQNQTIEWEKDKTVAACLQELQEQHNGCEIWIDHDRTVRAETARGEDKRDRVRITSGQVVSFNKATRDEEQATVIIVDGNPDEPTATATYSSSADLATYGRINRRVSAPNLMTEEACADLAEEIYNASKEPVKTYRISMKIDPLSPVAAVDLNAGDVVNIDLDDPNYGRIFEDARIVSRTIDVDTSAKTVTVELDLETALFNEDDSVMGRFAKGRFSPEVLSSLYDALYARN